MGRNDSCNHPDLCLQVFVVAFEDNLYAAPIGYTKKGGLGRIKTSCDGAN